MDKFIDWVDKTFSNILNQPERLYYYAVRFLQISCILNLFTVVYYLRFVSDIADLGGIQFFWSHLGLLPLLSLICFLLAQSTIRMMNPPTSKGVTALLATSLLGLFCSPLASLFVLITMATPPFHRLIKGAEPEWFIAIRRRLESKDTSNEDKTV